MRERRRLKEREKKMLEKGVKKNRGINKKKKKTEKSQKREEKEE